MPAIFYSIDRDSKRKQQQQWSIDFIPSLDKLDGGNQLKIMQKHLKPFYKQATILRSQMELLPKSIYYIFFFIILF